MVKNYFDDKNIEMLMTFDGNGLAQLVVMRDGSEYPVKYTGKWPDETFRPGTLNPKGPLTNINLLKTEVFDVLVWEELDEDGNVVRKHMSPHIRCRPYC